MKIFITGGTGFIGLPLVKALLEKGNELVILSRKDLSFFKNNFGVEFVTENRSRIKLINGDLSSTEGYRQVVIDFKPEIFYHLAWEGIPDHGPKMSQLNLQNGLNAYNLALQAGSKLIITTGSCWEYGTSKGGLTGELDEGAMAVPRDSFTAAKTTLRLIGSDLAREKDCDFVWARPFYVYGPRQREKSLIPSIISSVQKGIKPEIKTPFSKNDFSHVGDVSAALASFAEYHQKNPQVRINGIYNIGSGKSTEVQEIVSEVGNYFGYDYALRTDVPVERVDFCSNNRKIEQLTGWRPKVGLQQGIKEMCELAQRGAVGSRVQNGVDVEGNVSEIKTVLVTGNLGYIGSVLVPMLVEKKFKVIGYDINYYDKDCYLFPQEQRLEKQIIKDIRDVSEEDLRGVDAVIHLAGLSNDPLGEFNPSLTKEINYEGTGKLALAAKNVGVKRFVYASSQSMYGVRKSGEEVKESDPVDTSVMITQYARTKWDAECFLHQLHSDNFTVVCFRPSTVFGSSPKLRFDIVFNNLVGCAYTTGKIEIKSDGTPWRPVVHVRDVSNAFISGIIAPKEIVANKSYNVGIPNGNFTVRDLAEAAQKSVPGSTLVFTGEHGPDSRTYRVSFEKILTELKDYYHPEWNLLRGGKELVEVFKRVGLCEADFRGRKGIRINQLKHLVQEKIVDEHLRNV